MMSDQPKRRLRGRSGRALLGRDPVKGGHGHAEGFVDAHDAIFQFLQLLFQFVQSIFQFIQSLWYSLTRRLWHDFDLVGVSFTEWVAGSIRLDPDRPLPELPRHRCLAALVPGIFL
jgi:hypothetical protein